MNTGEAPIDNDSGGLTPAPGPLPESDSFFTGDWFPAKSPRIKSHGLLGRLAGRWLQILVLWPLISTPILLLIYALVKPTYMAASLLRVETAVGGNRTYLQTQIDTVTSDRVLEAAFANPLLVKLPTIKQSEDPRKDLREKLNVETIGETTIIRIALEWPDRNEAIAIVDAVAQSYLAQNQGHGRLPLNKVTEEEFVKLIDKQVQYHRDYRNAQSQLEAAKAIRKLDKDEINEELLARVSAEFLELPDVADLMYQIRETQELARSRFLTPPPKVVDARRELPRLLRQYEKLWASEYHAIRERLANEGQLQLSESRIQELEVAVEKARRQKESFTKQLENFQVVGEPDYVEYLATVIEPASASRTPSNDKRLRYVAAVPCLVLFLLLGSFLAQEIKADRRAAKLAD